MAIDRASWRDGATPALLDEERRFHLLAEHGADLAYRIRVRPELRVEYVSTSAARVTGHGPEEHYADPELLGKLVHPHDFPLFETMLRTPDAFEEPVTLRFIHRDGRVVWTEHRIAHVLDADNGGLAVEGLARDVTERVVAEEELWRTVRTLRRSEEERRRLLTLLTDTERRERRKLASDLHDDAIQIVSAAALRAGALERRVDDSVRPDVLALERTLHDAVERLRNLIFELRPSGLESEGLEAALRTYLRKLRDDCGIDTDLQVTMLNQPRPEVSATLYRIAQEALTNVRKHARAALVIVRVTERDEGYYLHVEDDGVGFGPDLGAAVPGHIGFPAMRERAELMGGWCTIHSAPGAGTTVEAWVPSSTH